MKKVLFIVLLMFFSSSNLVGQSLNDLDLKNGFRHFKLGSSPSEYKELKIDEEGSLMKKLIKEGKIKPDPDFKNYHYEGKEITHIAGVEIQEISFTFYKNKLYTIRVRFGDYPRRGKKFTEEQFNILLKNLEDVYGKLWIEKKIENNQTKDDSLLPIGGELINSAIWEGEKVELMLERRKMEFSSYGVSISYYGSIYIKNKNIYREILSSQF